jgi:hypothetical protein
VQHVPTIGKNLVNGSLLCRNNFKVVIESNKFVVSKCGQFIGKGYKCGGLFHFSVSDYCNKSVNLISDGINESDASVWHSRLYHLNFGFMFRLSTMSLIPNLFIVKVLSAIVVCNLNNLETSQGGKGEIFGTFRTRSFRYL